MLSPGRQPALHLPPEHAVAPVHSMLQPPQFLASFTTGMHLPLQNAWYGGHAQVPLTHCWPPGHPPAQLIPCEPSPVVPARSPTITTPWSSAPPSFMALVLSEHEQEPVDIPKTIARLKPSQIHDLIIH